MTILERDLFLAQLHDHLAQAAQGRGRLLFVCGESGGGKTALVEQFAESVRNEAPVSILSCDGLRVRGPYSPLFDIAEALGPDVEAVLAAQAPRDQIFRTVLSALRSASGANVLVGEDAQWTDEATLELLRFLGRRVGTTHTLFVVTYRDDILDPYHPLRRVLGDLINEPSVARLRLPPLSVEAVGKLAEGTGLDPVSLHERTGGNPFYVTEIIGSGGDTIPESIRDAVLGRASGISPEGRALLDAAAVLGVIVEPELLAALTGTPIADLVDECMAAGMLRDFGGRISFRHSLAREVFLASLSVPRRRDLHHRVLRIMEADPAHADDLPYLAHHAEESHDRDAVFRYAPAAARRAAAFGAHLQAAAQYDRALRFAQGLPDEDLAELLEAKSYECYLTGQLEEAISDRARAVEIRRSTGNTLKAGDNLRWLSRFSWFATRNADAERYARGALELLEPLPPGPELAMAYSNLSQLRMLSFDVEGAVQWGNRALALATELDHQPIRVHAMTNVGIALMMSGEVEGRRLLEQCVEIGRAHHLPDDVARAYAGLTWTCVDFAELAAADAYLEEGLAYTAEQDLFAMDLYLKAVRVRMLLGQGHWAQAVQEAEAVANLPSAMALSRIVVLTALGQIAARRGDNPADLLNAALTLAEPTGELMRLGPVRIARAEAAWLSGDSELAAAEAMALYDGAVRSREYWMAGHMALWLHRTGHPVETSRLLPEPIALEIAGNGREAAAFWQDRGFPLETARALASTGEEDALREALIIAERLGAKPDAARMVRALRQIGATSIPRGPRPTTQANPAGLTARELEILPFLAQGKTNRDIADALFLSPRTVGHHVSAILGKLELASRTGIKSRAVELGLLPD